MTHCTSGDNRSALSLQEQVKLSLVLTQLGCNVYPFLVGTGESQNGTLESNQ